MKIQKLLDENGNGPMGPVLFANIMAKETKIGYAQILRIFLAQEVHNYYENKGKKSLTGFDTVVFVTRFADETFLFRLYIDMDGEAMPVAIKFSNENEVVVTPIYQKANFEKKLSAEELTTLFEECLKVMQG